MGEIKVLGKLSKDLTSTEMEALGGVQCAVAYHRCKHACTRTIALYIA